MNLPGYKIVPKRKRIGRIRKNGNSTHYLYISFNYHSVSCQNPLQVHLRISALYEILKREAEGNDRKNNFQLNLSMKKVIIPK